MKNVILMTLDACRRDVFGCYGSEADLTPFIDSLQDRCIRFSRAQSTGPYTQASFPGILTSSYYLEYGWSQRCPSQRLFVSEVLRNAGIATAAFHSNPYLCAYFGWNRGWDVFMDSMQEKVTPEVPFLKGEKINRKAEVWLSSHNIGAGAKPFFLWAHYMDIHEPYIPARKYLDLVDPSLDLTEGEMLSLFREVVLPRTTSDPEKVETLRRLYRAHVREADDYVKDFFYVLERLNLLKEATIIITSDHGDEFNEHGGLSHDDKMYSELIDVPLLIYEPEREEGEVCTSLVSNIDIPPTIIHLFGLEPVQEYEGRSLLPTTGYEERGCYGEAFFQVKGKGADTERDVYFYREGDLKIIYRPRSDAWELYDLKNDPEELRNIIDTSSAADSLKKRILPRVRRWEKG